MTPHRTTLPGTSTASTKVPFHSVDEISRHCLDSLEPETVHIEVRLPGQPNPTLLREAFHRALLHHPRALVRQAPHRWHGRSYVWELTNAPDTDPVRLTNMQLDGLAIARARAIAMCPRLDQSPPLRLEVIMGQATGCVLLMTLHHTAFDAPSGLHLLATTAALYSGRTPGPGPAKAAHRPGPQRANTLQRPRSARPARLASERGNAAPHGNGVLLMDLPLPERSPTAAWTVNDQLLVAVALMVGHWNRSHGKPHGPVRITMPIDDRPPGTAMSLGNGTRLVEVPVVPADRSHEHLLLAPVPDPAAVADILHNTAAHTHRLKARRRPPMGAAAALLTAPVLPVSTRRALTRGVRRAVAPWTSTLVLSNIGRVPPMDFGDAGRASAVWFSGPARLPRGLSVSVASTDGRIHAALRWSRTLLDDRAGAALADLFQKCLAATHVPHIPRSPV